MSLIFEWDGYQAKQNLEKHNIRIISARLATWRERRTDEEKD
jgi:uncharacterized DUF497 family protein